MELSVIGTFFWLFLKLSYMLLFLSLVISGLSMINQDILIYFQLQMSFMNIIWLLDKQLVIFCDFGKINYWYLFPHFFSIPFLGWNSYSYDRLHLMSPYSWRWVLVITPSILCVPQMTSFPLSYLQVESCFPCWAQQKTCLSLDFISAISFWHFQLKSPLIVAASYAFSSRLLDISNTNIFL